MARHGRPIGSNPHWHREVGQPMRRGGHSSKPHFWMMYWPERTDAHVGQLSDLNINWLKEQTPCFNIGLVPNTRTPSRAVSLLQFGTIGMSNESIAHTIRNILEQCNSTTISIGHTEGHFLSSRQFAVLDECADTLESLESVAGVDTPSTSSITQASTEEDGVRSRRLQLAREIKQKQIQLTAASPGNRSQINLDIGKLLSERAKLDKLIKQFDTPTVV